MISGRRLGDGTAALMRLAVWLLPPHRKEWGAAMFNELEFLPSRAAAARWALGCTLTSVRERLVFELGWTNMTRRILKFTAAAGILLVTFLAGVYIIAKPYQRERIQIMVRHALSPDSSQAGSQQPGN
jgi:hypothetical protein